MSATLKILFGALATAILAFVLYGPLGFGARCAANAGAVVPATPAVETGAANVATPAAVVNCQATVDGIIKGKTINFANGSATLAASSTVLIDELAKSLKDCEGTTVEVAGHTDARGADAPNLALSERRAAAVSAALTAKGVPAARLTSKGYGETKLLDPAVTAEADAKNRRIEFTVATAAAAPAAQ
jgi:OmpA-OmpF porin, OOP family